MFLCNGRKTEGIFFLENLQMAYTNITKLKNVRTELKNSLPNTNRVNPSMNLSAIFPNTEVL